MAVKQKMAPFFWRLGAILGTVLLVLVTLAPFKQAAAQQPAGDSSLPSLSPGGPLYQAGTGPVAAGVGASALASLSPIADTELWRAQPNTNFGSAGEMYVGYRSSQAGRMVLRIPLWDLPPGVTINSAVLWLELLGWYDYQGAVRTITAYRATSPWHEQLATWNRAPGLGEAVGSFSVGTPTPRTWYSLDLTNLVRAWADGTYPNYGLVLIGPEGGQPVYRVFASAETVEAPALEVNYTLNPPTLGLTPTSFSFFAHGGSPGLHSQALHVLNTGSQPLQWYVNSSPSWVTFSQTNGTIAAGSAQLVNLNVNLAGLSYGTYSGPLQIASTTSGVQGTPQNAPVSLYYLEKENSTYLPAFSKAASGSASSAQKTAALIIGVSDYEFLSSASQGEVRTDDIETGDLIYPRWDAREEGDTLAYLNFFGGQAGANPTALATYFDNLLILTESQARRADIQAAFTWLDEHEDANTRVFIAYSGHGGKIQDDNADESDGLDEFIAAYDVYADTTYHNIIRDDTLATWLAALESQQIVVVLDSCYSGGVTGLSTLGLNEGRSKNLPQLDSNPLLASPGVDAADGMALDIGQSGRVVLTASTANQASWEFDELGHGVFTYYLLMALMDTAADTSHNGWVSAEEAFTYLAAPVDSYVVQHTITHSHQNPQLYDNVAGQVDLTRP